MINLMKSAWLALAFICVFGLNTASSTASLDYSNYFGGIIVEGDMLIATSNDVDDKILTVYVTNDKGEAFLLESCNDSECSMDLSHLAKGDYEVIIISEKGGFEGEIYIK